METDFEMAENIFYDEYLSFDIDSSVEIRNIIDISEPKKELEDACCASPVYNFSPSFVSPPTTLSSTTIPISEAKKELEDACCASPVSDYRPSFVSPPTTPSSTINAETVSADNKAPIARPLVPKKLRQAQFQELVLMPVKDFNRKVKTLALDEDTVNFLKLERKREKNREAAVRSRAKKDQYVLKLEQIIEELKKENLSNLALIKELSCKIEKLEAAARKQE